MTRPFELTDKALEMGMSVNAFISYCVFEVFPKKHRGGDKRLLARLLSPHAALRTRIEEIRAISSDPNVQIFADECLHDLDEIRTSFMDELRKRS